MHATRAARIARSSASTSRRTRTLPFGASILLAGLNVETKAPELYCIEPSGLSLRYFGTAIGKGARAAKTEIEKHKLFDMPVAEVLGRVAKILIGVHDEAKDKPFELELGWVCAASGWKFAPVPADVRAAAELWAKNKITEEEDADDDDE